MSTPYTDFTDWFKLIPGASVYTLARGWVDSMNNLDSRIASVTFMGGPKPDVDNISPQVRVLLLGKKGERTVAGALVDLEVFAYSMVARSMEGWCSGSITAIRSMAQPIGPAYTEDRPYFELNFELLGYSFQ